jgi:hypothetical protein
VVSIHRDVVIADDVATIDQHVAAAVAADVAERDGFGGSADRGHGRKVVGAAQESKADGWAPALWLSCARVGGIRG